MIPCYRSNLGMLRGIRVQALGLKVFDLIVPEYHANKGGFSGLHGRITVRFTECRAVSLVFGA